MFFIDGKESTEFLVALNSSEIESINILKEENALKKYGDQAKNGVVDISTKKKEE